MNVNKKTFGCNIEEKLKVFKKIPFFYLIDEI